MSKVVLFMSGAGGAFVFAVVIFVLSLVGHVALPLALVMTGIMAAYGVVLLVGRRWEAIAVLGAPAEDERAFQVHTRAAAAAGQVMALVIVGGFFYDMARGALDHSIWPPIGGVFGLSYLIALGVFVRRA